MKRARFIIGRVLIHLGLSIMPRGRVRSELYQLFELWGTKARDTVTHKGTVI